MLYIRIDKTTKGLDQLEILVNPSILIIYLFGTRNDI